MKIPEVLKKAVSALFSGTGKVLSGYGKVIGGYIKFAAIASLFLLLLPAAGIIFKISWLIGSYIALSAVLIVIGLILVVPVLTLAKAAVENIAPLKKAMVSLLAFLFWLLAIAIYFFVVPIGSLATALLVIAIFGLMALGYAAFGIRTNPRLAFGLAVIILVLLTLGSFFSHLFPNTQSAVTSGVGWVDKTISSLFTPKPNRIDLKTFPPFDSEGKVRVWYYKGKDGSLEFYDKTGYHWTGTPLKEITPGVLDQYMESLAPKPDLTPKKVDLSSYPPFDLVNGKPRTWYYQNSEGNFEFYDKPGFHWSGEQLKLITTQVVDEWRKAELKRKKVEEEQRIQRERQLQKIAEEERQKAERERGLQRQIEANRREAEKVEDRSAENIVLTPLPSPPSEPTLTPTQTQIWERTFQVWVDNSQSTEEVSRLIQKVSDSKTTFKVSDQFKSKKGVVGLSMRLINFGRTINIREVCEYFDSHGLRSATAKEFGFLYAEHADHLGNIKLDQNYEVISALGTSCQEHRYGPVFRNYEWPNLSEENKPYRLDKNNFDKYARFAAVQIKADRQEAEKAKDRLAEQTTPPTVSDYGKVFCVAVNYNRSIEEEVRAGHYDWISGASYYDRANSVQKEMRARDYQLSGASYYSPPCKGTNREICIQCMHLIRFNVKKHASDIHEELDKIGLRQANTRELLALGENYPDIQRQLSIVSLYGMSYSVCLYGDSSRRGLIFGSVEYEWDNRNWIAVIKK